MAIVTKTIGAAGNYTTIAAWMADLTNAAVYTAGDTAIGEVIDWTAVCFITLPTASVLPTSVTLKPATNRRHTGIIGTGCRLLPSATGIAITVINCPYNVTIDGFELDYQDQWATGEGAVSFGTTLAVTVATYRVSNCLFYGFTGSGGSNGYAIKAVAAVPGTANMYIQNCVVHRYRRSSGFGGTHGITASSNAGNRIFIHNCLVYDTFCIGAGLAYGIGTTTANIEIKNCISLDNENGDYFGTFSPASNNASGDATTPGTSGITGTTLQQFRAGIGGDFRLVAGSPLIGAGVAVAGLTVDLAGNPYSSPPSIGPLEYVPAGGPSETSQVFIG